MILSDAARELRNKRAREYYKTHKRQYAEANRRYWEKKAAEEQAKAQTEPPEDVEPVELGPVVLEDPTESAKE